MDVVEVVAFAAVSVRSDVARALEEHFAPKHSATWFVPPAMFPVKRGVYIKLRWWVMREVLIMMIMATTTTDDNLLKPFWYSGSTADDPNLILGPLDGEATSLASFGSASPPASMSSAPGDGKQHHFHLRRCRRIYWRPWIYWIHF